MKGNKKILIVAVLLLLIAVSYSTYAIYKSSASASDEISTAAWVVEVNTDDIVANNTFSLGNITWGSTRYGQNGTIAPGDTGTVTILIDASGSEVGVHYDVAIDPTALAALDNSNFTVAAHSGSSLSGNIAYGASMQATVTLDITWTGVDDDTAGGANEKDVALQGQDITLPVTVTVTQNPNPDA